MQKHPRLIAQMPLLHVDVKHGGEGTAAKVTRFSIFQGDDIERKIEQFANRFGKFKKKFLSFLCRSD